MDRLSGVIVLGLAWACVSTTDDKDDASSTTDTGTRATTGDTDTDGTDTQDTGCTPPKDTGRDFVQVSTAGDSACVRRASGRVECWGDIAEHAVVPECAFIDVDVIDYNSALGLLADGGIRWLANDEDGWLEDSPTGAFTALWANKSRICAIEIGGTAVCWGVNPVEDASSVDPLVEVQSDLVGYTYTEMTAWRDENGAYAPHFAGIMEPVRDLDVSEDDVCVLDANGDLGCYGAYNYTTDEYGDNFYDVGVWLSADAPDDGWYAVEMDTANACVLDAAGSLTCLNYDERYTVDLPSDALTSISGASDGCGITLSGEIACWSHNGQTFPTPPAR